MSGFDIGFYGRKQIATRFDTCIMCKRLTLLSSYTTGRFLSYRDFPLIPLGQIHVTDECPYCGTRGHVTNRKYQKQRTSDLAVMMDTFTSEPDNPDTARNGLRTLMVYNEEAWFMDVEQAYGRRFEKHMQVQLVIAQGLCRFGHYDEAALFCRKAVVLGAGPKAEELLNLCLSLREKKNAAKASEMALCPESMLRPYAFIIGLAACLLITFSANIASAMRNHTAWLVNGSPMPYTVEIDDNQYHLDPYEVERIKLRLGEHRMQTPKLPRNRAPVWFSYKTSLLRQKFGNHALVLNPDAMAVIITETRDEGEGEFSHRFGKKINKLTGINHRFTSFPMLSATKRSAQTRLYTHTSTNHMEAVELLRLHGRSGAAEKYARRALLLQPSGPETPGLLAIAIADLNETEAAAFLKLGMPAFPPSIEWHKTYQDLIESNDPENDLQNEYALLCEKHPDIPEYFYLLGLVVRDQDKAKILFEKAEQGDGSKGKGYHAIALNLFYTGRFSAALPYSRQALACSPDDSEFIELNQQILLALKQYDRLLAALRTTVDSGDGRRMEREVQYLTLSGEHTAASRLIAQHAPVDGKDSVKWDAHLNAIRFYAVGNIPDYLDNLIASQDPTAPLQHLLYSGQIEEAHELLSQNENHDYTAHLVLYCAAKLDGRSEIEEEHWTKATAEIEGLSRDRREQIAILSDGTPPTTERLVELPINPQEKSLLCCALGHRFPEKQAELFRLARLFNYVPEHPQLLLKTWTTSSP